MKSVRWDIPISVPIFGRPKMGTRVRTDTKIVSDCINQSQNAIWLLFHYIEMKNEMTDPQDSPTKNILDSHSIFKIFNFSRLLRKT